MKSKKMLNEDGATKRIVLEKDGAYMAFTPKQAAMAINELRAQLWRGNPLMEGFIEARNN